MHRILSSLLLPCAVVAVLFSFSPQQAHGGELAKPVLRMAALYYMNDPLLFTFMLKNNNAQYDLGPVLWTIYVYYVQTNICMYTLQGSTNVNKSQEVEVNPSIDYEPAAAGQYRVEVHANSEVNISGEQVGTATVQVLAAPACSLPPSRTPSGGIIAMSEGNTITYTAPPGCCYYIDPFINTGVWYSLSPSTRQTISDGQSVTFTLTAKDPNPMASVVAFAWTECTNGSPKGKDYIVVSPVRFLADTASLPPPYGPNVYIGVFGDPVSASSGQFILHEKPDIEIAASPISFSRTFDGGAMNAGIRPSVGLNWAHSYSSHVVRDNEWCYVQLADGRRFPFEKVGSEWMYRGKGASAHLQETVGGWIATDVTHTMQYTFNAHGLLVKEDNGRQPVYVNWTDDAITSVTDSIGHTLTFTTDSLARITKIEDGTRTVRFTHTPKNELMFATSMTGLITTYAYDVNALGRLTKVSRAGIATPIITNEYNAAGKIVKQTNSLGKNWTYSYETGKSTVIDPDGTTEIQTFNTRSRLTTAGPEDQAVALQYNAQGFPTQIANAEGDITKFTWHASGRPASIENSDGTTQFAYTPRTWNGAPVYDLTKITNTDGTSRSFMVDGKGLVTQVTDESGKAWTFQYDLKTGKETLQKDPLNNSIGHQYDASGHLRAVVSPTGVSTAYTTNSQGNITSVTHGDASQQSLSYDQYGRLITVYDETNRQQQWVYDNHNRVTSFIAPSNATTEWTYDSEGRIATMKTPRNGTFTLGYTDAGRLSRITDPMNGTLSNVYNEQGRVGAFTDRGGSEYNYSYNKDGGLISTRMPTGGITRFTLDERGRSIGLITPTGLQYTHQLDDRGRLLNSVEPDGRAVSYQYDNVGRVISQTVTDDLEARFFYDVAGKLTSVSDPKGSIWYYNHEAGGILSAFTDPAGRSTAYVTDDRDRVIRVALPGASGSANLEYDDASRLVRVEYTDGVTLHYSYNADGRIVGTENDTCAFDLDGNVIMSNGILMERNLNGWITKMRFGAGELNYAYDAAGRLVSISDWAGGVTRYSHDADGNLTKIERPNGVSTDYTRDADGRVTNIKEGSIASIALTYGNGNRIASAVRVGHLEHVVKSEWSATYDEGNVRIDLGYDAVGRTTSADSLAITWDVASRLREISGVFNASVTYDGFGRPTAVTIGDVPRTLVWNDAFGEGLPAVIRTPNSAVFVVPTAGGSVAYLIDSATGTRLFPHYTESGNTAIVTDDDGNVKLRVAYEPYGAIAATEGSAVYPFLFGGAGGVVMISPTVAVTGARTYHAKAGRFLSPDPIRSLHPMRINPFQYAQCDPINWRDWTGRSPEPAPRSIDEIIDASNRRLEEANRQTQERYEADMRKLEEQSAKRRAEREARERAEREGRERIEEQQRKEQEEIRKDKEAFDRAWAKANELNDALTPKPTEPATPDPAPGTGEDHSTPGTQSSGSNVGGNGQPPSSGGTRTRPPKVNPAPTGPNPTPAPRPQGGPKPPVPGGTERGHYSEPGSNWYLDFLKALFGFSN